MPTISSFYGIVILMYQVPKEHNPPHIHARYGDYEASFLISNGEVFNGCFPKKGSKLVKEFIKKHRQELLSMWETGQIYKIKGLE